jgi:S-adenosyl methyltransferase
VIEVSVTRSKGASVTSEGAPVPDERPGDVVGDGEDSPTFDTSVAHVARVYDYWLGGKDNFAVDREGPVLAFAPADWETFTAAVRAGEF